jgi:hypothetical protein
MPAPAPRTVTPARLLHYWSKAGNEPLQPNPALVLRVGADGALVYVRVFWASGAGSDALWAPSAPYSESGEQEPTEGHWTWPRRV